MARKLKYVGIKNGKQSYHGYDAVKDKEISVRVGDEVILSNICADRLLKEWPDQWKILEDLGKDAVIKDIEQEAEETASPDKVKITFLGAGTKTKYTGFDPGLNALVTVSKNETIEVSKEFAASLMKRFEGQWKEKQGMFQRQHREIRTEDREQPASNPESQVEQPKEAPETIASLKKFLKGKAKFPANASKSQLLEIKAQYLKHMKDK